MKKTFVCDSSMIITIPIKSLRDVQDGHLMPDNFHCVFKDSYKVFVLRGKPKAFGGAQATVGMLLFTLGVVSTFIPPSRSFPMIYTSPSVLFVICGMLSFGAGRRPNMHVTKVAFFLNISSFVWSIVAISLCVNYSSFHEQYHPKLFHGIQGLILSLLVGESLITLFMIYWFCKAVCKENFNTLPIVLLKQAD
ncbi:uncharacterized protein LOC133430261 [Cololabis saira]|uniref:uncharacterized protein LOC133430261 n=1 Tax=Cololabis saira TaxID=129043 RepID=UPI002AD3B0F0|nr:uncharacterized protein LOC133430261 [Cololabis saira]